MMTTGMRCRSRSFCLALWLAAIAMPAQAADAQEKSQTPDAVAGQMLKKIQRDCRLPVAGGVYRLGSAQCRSVRDYPDYFLSGALAPDLYPDPLAARVAADDQRGGWQRRDWLRHIVGNAEPGAPLAFALGYLLQAGQDALVDAPANVVAGGEFRAAKNPAASLAGKKPASNPAIDTVGSAEMEASARHLLSGHSRVPALFLKDTLLFDADAVAQYRRSGVVPHLVAMNDVRSAVVNMTLDLEALEDIGTEMLAHYQAEDLDRASRQQMTAELWPELRKHEQLLQDYKHALAATDALRQQQEALQERVVKETLIIAEADRDLHDIDQQMTAQRGVVLGQQKKLAALPRQQTEENCRMVKKWINKKEWTSNRVCLPKNVASPEWVAASNALAQERKRISEMEQHQDAVRASRAHAVAAVEVLRKEGRAVVTEAQTLELARQRADMAYRQSLQALQSQQLPALAAGDRVPVAAADVEVLQSLLDERAAMMTALRQSLDDLHELSFIGRDWQSVMDRAGDEYLYAGSRVSGKLRADRMDSAKADSGKPTASEEYRRWLSCDGRAFLDKPYLQGCDKPLPYAEAAGTLQHLEQTLRTPGLGELNDLYQVLRRGSIAAMQKATAEADARLAAFVAPDGALAHLGEGRSASSAAVLGNLHPTHELVQK
jgi:hypothetical protein